MCLNFLQMPPSTTHVYEEIREITKELQLIAQKINVSVHFTNIQILVTDLIYPSWETHAQYIFTVGFSNFNFDDDEWKTNKVVLKIRQKYIMC